MDPSIDLTENRDFRFSSEGVVDPYLHESSIIDLVGEPRPEYYYSNSVITNMNINYRLREAFSSLSDSYDLSPFYSVFDEDPRRDAIIRKERVDEFWEQKLDRFEKFLTAPRVDQTEDTTAVDILQDTAGIDCFTAVPFFAFVNYKERITQEKSNSVSLDDNTIYFTQGDNNVQYVLTRTGLSSKKAVWNINNGIDGRYNTWFIDNTTNTDLSFRFSYTDMDDEELDYHNDLSLTIYSKTSTSHKNYASTISIADNWHGFLFKNEMDDDFCEFVKYGSEKITKNIGSFPQRFILFILDKRSKHIRCYSLPDVIDLDISDEPLHISEYSGANDQLMTTVHHTNEPDD